MHLRGYIIHNEVEAILRHAVAVGRAGNGQGTRLLVPTCGPTVWQRRYTSATDGEENTAKSDLEKQEPSNRKGKNAPSGRAYKPLRTASTQQEIGQELRKALKQGADLDAVLGHPDSVIRKHGIIRRSRPRQKAQFDRKLEYAASATATLGKYRASTVTSEYSQDAELSNDIDQMLEEGGVKREPLNDLRKTPNYTVRKSDIERNRTKAPSPSWDQLGEFERQLYRNPYAQQLASPVRACSFSAARLPSALLASFRVKMSPEDGDLWVAPDDFDLRRKESPYTSNFDPLSLKSPVPYLEKLPKFETDDDKSGIYEPLQVPNTHLLNTELALRRVQRTYPEDEWSQYGPPAGRSAADPTTTRMHCIATLTTLSRFPTLLLPRHRRSINSRWREQVGKELFTGLKIRPDLPEFVLKLIRRRAARYLAYAQHTGQGVMIPFSNNDPDLRSNIFKTDFGLPLATVPIVLRQDASKRATTFAGGEIPAAVLWFGHSWGEAFPYKDVSVLPKLDQIAPATASRSQVPIFNTQELFSEIEWNWLRALRWADEEGEHDVVFREDQVVIMESIWSFHSLDWLWRLQMIMSSARVLDYKSTDKDETT